MTTRAASALWARVGPRGLALLFFAVLDLIYGWSLLSPPSSSPSGAGWSWLISIMPLESWGILWMTVGIVLLAGVFVKDDSLPWAAAFLIKVLWGLLWLLGWIIADVPRGYASAAIWLPFAGLVAVLAIWLPGSGHKGATWIRRP